MKLKDAPWKKSYNKCIQHIKKQKCHFTNKGPCSQSYGFPSSHVWMWELEHKEGWGPKNWCFRIVVLEEKILILGKIEGRKRRGWQRMRWLDGITWVWVNSRRQWRTGKPGMLQSMGSQRVEHDWATEQQLNNNNKAFYYFIYILLISFYLFSLSDGVTCINLL